MATEVGQATIKLSFDTKSLDKSQAEAQKKMTNAGTTSGSAWGNAWTVAAGNLIAKGIQSVVSAINNNLNSAIKRADVLNNFPKVMANLGISAEASAEVIQDLSEKLTGLPTTLDSAASAVQRFVSKNGDVKKSEQIFLAVNDAILAGGASADIQATALEQLSQAYAKGKPDMMEWRTLQTAMPAQLKQVAMAFFDNRDALDSWLSKARQFAKDNPLNSTAKELVEQLEAVAEGSGDMSTALGTALRSGVISMDDFTETIIKLDKTGVKGFASLSKQAKDATGGIGTSLTNLNTAITKATTGIINAIGPERIAKAIQGVISVINGLSKVVSGVVNFIIDNGPVIVAIIGSIAAAIATMVVVGKIAALIQEFGALNLVIQGVNVAMQILNGTMALNPIALVAGLVVGLTAAMVSLSAVTNDADNAHKQLMSTLEEEQSSIQQNKESWSRLQETRQKNIDAGMTEIANYQSLYSELTKIVDANGRVQEGYEGRASFIVSTLKNALGVEIEMVDGVVQGYANIRDGIDQVIAKKKAQIILEAQEASYKEAITNKAEAIRKLIEYQSQLNEKQSEQKAITEELSTLDGRVSFQRVAELEKRRDQLNEELSMLQSNYSAQDELVNQYLYNIGLYENNAALAHQERYNEMSQVTWDFVKEYQNAGDAEKAVQQDIIDVTGVELEKYTQMHTRTSQDIFNDQINSAQRRNSAAQDEMKQYNSITESGLKTNGELWNKGLARALSEISGKQVEFRLAGDGTVTQFVDGEKSKEWDNIQAWNETMNAGKSAVESYMGTFKGIGGNISDGLTAGIRANGGNVAKTIADIVINAADAARAAAKIQSPSKVMAEIGYYMDAGLELGISKNASSVIGAAQDMTNGVISAVTGNGEISISGSTEVSDHSSVLEEVYLKTAEDNAKSQQQKQPMIVNLELDGQQIQRVILQDERRSTI